MSNEFDEKVIEQTEQMVNMVNEISDEEFEASVNALFNVSDEEINSSLNALESTNDKDAVAVKKMKARTKKTAKQLAEEVVNEYLSTRSDKAWQNLQEFFWYGIKQFAYKYVKNWEDAYDMTIETFISALENINRYDPEKAKFSTWLWTICRNNCLHYLKEQSRIPTVDTDLSDIYDSEMLKNSYSHETKDYKVNGGMINEIESDDITVELYNVSINEMNNIGGIGGQILKMKLVDNLKIREIADKLDMNESTIKNYLYKNKENLSRILRINHKELYDMYIDSKTNDGNSLYL